MSVGYKTCHALAVFFVWCVAARTSQAVRQLQEASTECPGCAADGCVSIGTVGAYRCTLCLNNLVVDQTTGRCVCPPGYYSEASNSCGTCLRGHFCPGGLYSPDDPSSAPQMQCPANMTTLGRRSSSRRSCVNMPGFYYTLDAQANPGAVLCPANSWSAGMKKQRACVPCPTGFVSLEAGASSVRACVVPAGSYLKSPGVAALCPRGEYKSGLVDAGSCDRCAFGVTTAQEGSTSVGDCAVLLPGVFAASIAPSWAITATGFCPQGSVCPGGKPSQPFNPSNLSALSVSDTTVQACPDGMWTKEVGSRSLLDCLTPPGFYTAAGETMKCSPGSYRSDWKPPGEATSCVPCGQGVLADATDRVTKYAIGGIEAQEVAVATSPEDCYILAGQGLYYESLTNSWRASNCTDSQYGVADTTYGLSPKPCRACPFGTEARENLPASAKHLGANGFTSKKACVTRPGFGYSGRIAQPCAKGSYNQGGDLGKCSECPLGFTTRGVGVGRSIADCVAAPGYGAGGNGLAPCPQGTYNERVNSNLTASCVPCPQRTTTEGVGSDSKDSCTFCVAGYSGQDCSQQCGGVATAASFGPPGRLINSPCVPCSSQGKTVGFSFDFNMQNDLFAPRTVARPRASSATDCLSEYAQVVDGSWYLPLSSSQGTSTTKEVPSFAACVDICSATACQLLTYDYVDRSCMTRVSLTPIDEGAPFLALKTLNSGYVGTSSLNGQGGNVSAKMVSSGGYLFYQEPYALDVGIQRPAKDAASFISVQECTRACDDMSDCAGVTVLMTVEPWKIGSTCRLVFGDATPGRFKRSLVRADLDRIGFRTTYLCPSGFEIQTDIITCTPITTVQAAVFVLTAQGTCDAATIQSVKDAITNFLSDETSAFGVYVPKLIVKVSCISVQTTQATLSSARRRRLLAAETNSTVAIAVEATYAGSRMGSENVVQKLDRMEAAQCTVPGLCENLEGASLRRSWTDPEAVRGGTLLLTIQSANESSVVVRATYNEAGTTPVDMPIFIVLEDEQVRLPCVQSLDGVSRLFNCAGPLGSNITLKFTASAPNTVVLAEPLTTSVTYTSCVNDTIIKLAGNHTSQNRINGIPALEFALAAPLGIAFDAAGNTLVSDEGTNQVYKVDRSGVLTVFAGTDRVDSSAGGLAQRKLMASMQQPSLRRDWMRRTRQGADEAAAANRSGGAEVRAAQAGQPQDWAARLGEGVPALNATFLRPSRMVVDAAGNTYIADTFAHAVRVISAATGMVTTYAGVLDGETYGGGFSGDGGLATSALLSAPMGLALHPRTGDLYIADSLNCRIRQVEAATGLISTFAGNGCPCVYETNQPECLQDGAVFGPYLSGIAFDSAGSLFVVDTFFSTVWKISAGTSTPVVFAGKPATMDAYSPGGPIAAGDRGPAVDTAVWYPIDVAVHPQYDDVFIAHWPPESPEARVRRVDALTGVIFTEVGGAIVPQPIPEGEEVPSGDGGPPSQAFLPSVWGIGVGPHGSLAISHDSNGAGAVRKVSCLQY